MILLDNFVLDTINPMLSNAAVKVSFCTTRDLDYVHNFVCNIYFLNYMYCFSWFDIIM